MLSTTRKPKPRVHPRSLDALFPRPKVKRCAHGHSQTPEWRPSWGCSTCRKQEEEFTRRQWERTEERKSAARVERLTEAAKLPRLPDPYLLRDHSGRVVGIFRAGGRRRRRRA
jgi:hypothetical protein